ncbi:hypothetical protein KGQ55_00925 [Patescibacteria group bacterium]|nr:hypothetical protein [Patescibacteria group bacterium]
MNQTSYRSRLSPYQLKPQHPIDVMRAKVYDVQDKENPIRAEIEKCIGTHTIKAVVEEDRQTLDAMGVDGLISFLCTMTKDGRVLSQGRGSAMIGPQNRFFQRTVACAFNSALADAAIRATKVLDQLRDKSGAEETYEDSAPEPATDKQREYLKQLIQANVRDESALATWMNRIGEISKSEASDAIKSFKN